MMPDQFTVLTVNYDQLIWMILKSIDIKKMLWALAKQQTCLQVLIWWWTIKDN